VDSQEKLFQEKLSGYVDCGDGISTRTECRSVPIVTRPWLTVPRCHTAGLKHGYQCVAPAAWSRDPRASSASGRRDTSRHFIRATFHTRRASERGARRDACRASARAPDIAPRRNGKPGMMHLKIAANKLRESRGGGVLLLPSSADMLVMSFPLYSVAQKTRHWPL